MQIFSERISAADSGQIHILLDAVLEHFKVLYPKWEIGTMSIRKCENPAEEIDRVISLMESVKRVSAGQGSLKQSIAAAVDFIQRNTQK